MGLQSIIQNAAVSAFKALGDVPHAAVLKHKTNAVPVYDTASGAYTNTEETVNIAGALFGKMQEREVSAAGIEDLKATDRRISFPRAMLGGKNVSVSDTITDTKEAVTYSIIAAIANDPAGAMVVLQGRPI